MIFIIRWQAFSDAKYRQVLLPIPPTRPGSIWSARSVIEGCSEKSHDRVRPRSLDPAPEDCCSWETGERHTLDDLDASRSTERERECPADIQATATAFLTSGRPSSVCLHFEHVLTKGGCHYHHARDKDPINKIRLHKQNSILLPEKKQWHKLEILLKKKKNRF